jgi:hypothetical protein
MGLAHEFNLVCVDGAVGSCVPACSEALRGDLLLMNLGGEDSKYSCELHHGLHSWVGAATDGGYLGSDVQTFLSAVLSGAAGYYALTLGADAGVAVDVVIHPGQDVRISGGASASSWGLGSFTVQQGGSLLVAGVALAGTRTRWGWSGEAITVQGGGTATVSGASLIGLIAVLSGGDVTISGGVIKGVNVPSGANVTISGGAIIDEIRVASGGMLDMRAIIVPPQVTIVNDMSAMEMSAILTRGVAASPAAQCALLADKYTNLSNAWRATSNGGTAPPGSGGMGDVLTGESHCSSQHRATDVGGGGWYRFVGAGGDALPLTTPGYVHCGTDNSGWLSGWDANTAQACTTYHGNSVGCPTYHGNWQPSCVSGRCGPPYDYSTAGRYPTIAEGVVEMTACFDTGGSPIQNTCSYHLTVGVIRCGSSLLWRLPYAHDCTSGFCTAPSGL